MLFRPCIKASLAVAVWLTLAPQGHAALPFTGFADIVEKASDAVVIINARVQELKPAPLPPLPPGLNDSELKDLLQRFFDDRSPSKQKGASKGRVEGVGSGFLIDQAGYVVTNHHVIEDATDITIELSTGQRLPAKIVGSDEKTDLAVLRIEGEGYPTLRFGRTDTLRVGDVILAIGAPFGLGGSVSSGIVSAKGRDIGTSQFDNFLQTDAAINDGNSGGPLLNILGEVVGVNTAIISETGSSVGVGFAIPSETVQHAVSEIIKAGYVRRGWIGVEAIPTNSQISEALGFRRPTGVIISEVDDDSPAYAAGLVPGDVLLTFNGTKINKPAALQNAIAVHPVGQIATMAIMRNAEFVEVNVEVALERDLQLKVPKRVRADYPALAEYGLTVEIRDGAIVVEHVAEGSRAALAGFEFGDEITALAGRNSYSLDDVESSLSNGRLSVVKVYKSSIASDIFIAVK